jgi:hypothetical protein
MRVGGAYGGRKSTALAKRIMGMHINDLGEAINPRR